MRDESKTKKEFIEEFSALRQRIANMERIERQMAKEHYRAMVDAAPISIMAIREGCFVFVNPAGARMLGFSNPDEIVGRLVIDFIEPESQQLVTERISRLENGMDNPIAEVVLIRPDGMRITVESTSVSVTIGGIPTAVIIAQDISERKQLGVNLKESEERFRAFMDNIPAVAYIKDESGKHIYGNQTLFDMFETSLDKFVGTTTKDFFPTDTTKKIEAHDSKVLTYGNAIKMEPYYVETRGQKVWWTEVKFPFRDYSGATMVGGLAFNVTELKLAEVKLKEAFNEIKELKERLERENIYLQEEIELQNRQDEIIGESKAVHKMLSQAEQVAGTDSTVLILGETGTGKELLARAIHRMSSRHHHPMITVNCAALPATLIESEMFGREKGAFTGALSGRTGRFEIAGGSTIFLDEIGELTTDVQMKLLRVLEEGQFERLGSNKTIKVDVRIIAATNRDLVKMLHEGSFRRDLYYRLNVFPIRVPSLNDRIEDLEQLVWAFVKEYGERMGKRIESIPRKSIEALKRCPWQGNIRELRNVIEQSMITTHGTTLNVKLPETLDRIENQTTSLEDVERNHIQKILDQTGWRVRGKAGAAELLGLKPTTLDARMKKLGIVRPK